MFGLFRKKKPETALDVFIHTVYGNPPPRKTAKLEASIQLALEELLCGLVSEQDVTRVATELNSGPIPYSTHDLAVSVALAFFKQPERIDHLFDAQLLARLKVSEWTGQKKVVAPLAETFENVLYRLYRQTVPESQETTVFESREATLSPAETALFDTLRKWRSEVCREQGVPAYTVFHDAAFRAVAKQRPTSIAELIQVHGVGDAKAKQYGAAIMKILAETKK